MNGGAGTRAVAAIELNCLIPGNPFQSRPAVAADCCPGAMKLAKATTARLTLQMQHARCWLQHFERRKQRLRKRILGVGFRALASSALLPFALPPPTVARRR